MRNPAANKVKFDSRHWLGSMQFRSACRGMDWSWQPSWSRL